MGNRQFSFHGSAPAIGTLGYYKVEYSSGNLYYYVGATLVRSHSTWFTPNQAEVAAETHSYDDQMPGAYYTRMHFYDTRNRVSGGSYLAFDGYVFNSDASQYLLQGLSMYNFDVWDSACLY